MYKPTQLMSRITRRALTLRASMPRNNRAGTPIGVARAHQFAGRIPVSLQIVQRTYNFLIRNQRFKDYPEFSKARQAWLLWGGLPAFQWAKRILKKEGIL